MQSEEEKITDLIDLMPSKAVSNAVFSNRGDFSFEDKRYEWGLNQASLAMDLPMEI